MRGIVYPVGVWIKGGRRIFGFFLSLIQDLATKSLANPRKKSHWNERRAKKPPFCLA